MARGFFPPPPGRPLWICSRVPLVGYRSRLSQPPAVEGAIGEPALDALRAHKGEAVHPAGQAGEGGFPGGGVKILPEADLPPQGQINIKKNYLICGIKL